MTEEAPKITSAIKTPRKKNPGRVAAGKRLAAISKEAKERKKLERAAGTVGTEGPERSEAAGGVNSSVILVGGLVATGVALYFLKFHNTDALRDNTDAQRDREDNTTEEPSPKFQAYSMDD